MMSNFLIMFEGTNLYTYLHKINASKKSYKKVGGSNIPISRILENRNIVSHEIYIIYSEVPLPYLGTHRGMYTPTNVCLTCE